MTGQSPDFDDGFRVLLDDLLVWRRDVRRFRTDPVPSETLEAALRTFNLAPSVGNSQPWRLVLVESDRARRAVRESFQRCNHAALLAMEPTRGEHYARLKLAGLEEAPTQLAIFCDLETCQGHGLGTRTMPETLAYSVAGAVTLFALVARAHSLGVGWVSILEPDVIMRELDIPEAWRLIAYLCVGFPEREDDRPELEREGWQERRRERSLLRR